MGAKFKKSRIFGITRSVFLAFSHVFGRFPRFFNSNSKTLGGVCSIRSEATSFIKRGAFDIPCCNGRKPDRTPECTAIICRADRRGVFRKEASVLKALLFCNNGFINPHKAAALCGFIKPLLQNRSAFRTDASFRKTPLRSARHIIAVHSGVRSGFLPLQQGISNAPRLMNDVASLLIEQTPPKVLLLELKKRGNRPKT